MQQILKKYSNNGKGRRPRNWCKFFIVLFFMSSNVVAFADRLEWDKVPLKLDLEVGTERFVHFSFPVDVGVPDNLVEHARIQVVGNSVYLTATQDFDRQRFLFRSREDGTVMVVDIKADTTEVSSEHVYINDASRTKSNQPKKRWTPAQLTQFAARVLYAPQRLRLSSNGLTEVSLPNQAVSLIRHERIHVRPYASWKTEQGLFVTVLILTNPTNQPIELHPLMLRGRWVAATFHHYRLLPVTTNANITALYLISEQPFAQALEF
ncbi:MAG: TIGR03749 family integrating conjugative element protein [Gammaproteobacteria bacterium]|nr:TIGR03749 family integrating conjugative element protein [Gammaproteobacteria bacterium]MYF03290.1 TIGR03749 family integrating conjugative element protein [Gammaproteobacteria bacterium]